jgi:hypothetical protein
MLALLLASSITAAEIHGAWNAVVKGDRVQLNMARDHSSWGRTLPRSEFTVADDEMNSAVEKPVRFSLQRDAGTINFTGTFEQGEGVGRFAFVPNHAFPETLRSLGVASDEPLDDERLFSLAMHDISTGFIREMQSLGYRETLESFVRFRVHGVTPDFVRDLRSLGYDKLTGEDLVRFRIHGVSPQFIRDVKELGFAPSAEDLVRFRIHGVSPEYVRGMRELGVTDLSPEALVRMRIHGVSTEYVRGLRDLGYNNVSSDDLARMRIHGVSIAFIRELADAGYHGIPIEKLVQMRIHGIEAATLPKQ